jgi:hypothetical protein
MNETNAREVLGLLVGPEGLGSEFQDVGIEVTRLLVTTEKGSRAQTITHIRNALEQIAGGVKNTLAVSKAIKAVYLAYPQEGVAIKSAVFFIQESNSRGNPHLAVGNALALFELLVRESNAGSPDEHYFEYLVEFLVAMIKKTHSVEMDKDAYGFLGNLVGKANSMCLLRLAHKLLAAVDHDVISGLNEGTREDCKDGLVQIIDRIVTRAFLSLLLPKRLALAGAAGKEAWERKN